MRKLNIFLVAGILITFLLHTIMSSLKLFGADADSMKIMAYICVGLITAHIIITCILTAQSLKARKLSGAGYFKNNLLFWTRRISGFTILIPLVMHIMIFRGSDMGAFRLEVFNTGRLVSQILLVLTLAFHVLINIRPALISLGVKETKYFSVDIIFVISVVLLIAAAAFGVYYIRWISY